MGQARRRQLSGITAKKARFIDLMKKISRYDIFKILRFADIRFK